MAGMGHRLRSGPERAKAEQMPHEMHEITQPSSIAELRIIYIMLNTL
jgi:hypothetical protein